MLHHNYFYSWYCETTRNASKQSRGSILHTLPLMSRMRSLILCCLSLTACLWRSTIASHIYEIRSTTIFSKQATCDPQEMRQMQENERLLGSLNRDKGMWERRHPRYRLLDALHGYLSHYDLVSKDVNRWRSMYQNIPKQQRKVWASSWCTLLLRLDFASSSSEPSSTRRS